VIDSSTPWRPHARLEQRLAMAISDAAAAAALARAEPDTHQRRPAPLITLFTSAKSRLISPGVVIRSVIPGHRTAAPDRHGKRP